MPFDPGKDLLPVAPILSYYNVLVINKDLPFKNLRELVDYAKANPGKVSYGSAGMGGSTTSRVNCWPRAPAPRCCTCPTRATRRP